MSNEKQPKVKFEAPVGKALEQAYREEANWFEREASNAMTDREAERKMSKAKQYRRLADRMAANRKRLAGED